MISIITKKMDRSLHVRRAMLFTISASIYFLLASSSHSLFNTLSSNIATYGFQQETTSPVYISVSNIDELKNGTFKVNEYVKTLGYYTPYDGGGNEFIIKEGNFVDNGGTVIQITDTKFAVSVEEQAPTFQQFGATGNGSTNDFDKLNNALNSGISEFNAGSGTYNLNNNSIKLPKYIKIYGNKDKHATIKNGCFISPYGVSLSCIDFDGGAYNKLIISGRAIFEGRFQSIVSPVSTSSVSYDSCVFSNSDYCSFAMVGPYQTNLKFNSDTVTNCIFQNVSYIAVYHCLNSNKTNYSNNQFLNIGSTNVTTGRLGALKLGDTTNASTLGVLDATIYGNTFDNLTSGDDYSGAKHVLDCNFITVYGLKATIQNNTISNLNGFGNDREAIYTKVRYCSILGNTITNGGHGEGYICNKGYNASDAYAHINNNTIIGTEGVGIQNYGAAEIANNHISITNCSIPINCMGKNYAECNRLLITENVIECGLDLLNMTTDKKNVIQVSKPSSETRIDGNQITCSGNRKLESVIKVGGFSKNVYIRNNTINSTLLKCAGVLVYSSEEYQDGNSKLWCDLSGNTINVYGQPLSVVVKGTQASARQYNIKNNTLNDLSKASNYAVTVTSSTKNNDIVYYSNNTKNTNRDIYTTTKRSSVGKNVSMINRYQ